MVTEDEDLKQEKELVRSGWIQDAKEVIVEFWVG